MKNYSFKSLKLLNANCQFGLGQPYKGFDIPPLFHLNESFAHPSQFVLLPSLSLSVLIAYHLLLIITGHLNLVLIINIVFSVTHFNFIDQKSSGFYLLTPVPRLLLTRQVCIFFYIFFIFHFK